MFVCIWWRFLCVTWRKQSYCKVEQQWHKSSVLTLLPSNPLFLSLRFSLPPLLLLSSVLPLNRLLFSNSLSSCLPLPLVSIFCLIWPMLSKYLHWQLLFQMLLCHSISKSLKCPCMCTPVHTLSFSLCVCQWWDQGFGTIKEDEGVQVFVCLVCNIHFPRAVWSRIRPAFFSSALWQDLTYVGSPYCLSMTDNKPGLALCVHT